MSRINSIRMEKGGFHKFRTPGELIEDSQGQVRFVPDPLLQPVTSTSYSSTNREGCLLQYEAPIRVGASIPDDAYIIAVDPVANNNDGGASLNAVIVFKTPKHSHVIGEEKIVATYFGRKKIRPLDYLHRLLVKLSKYYNAKITYENDRDGNILSYFTHTGNLNRLIPSPTLVTKKYYPIAKHY